MRPKSYRFFPLVAVIALMSISRIATAADRPYTEGPVVVVTSVRTAPGGFDDYMAWVAGPWKQFMEAQKKAGVILDYRVYQTRPATPSEPDLYLEVTYKNWSAFDGLDAKVDPISERVFGPRQQANAAAVARDQIRTVLGDQTMQQLNLK